MTTEPNENLLPESQETVMVYINPDVIQTMADLSAERRQNLRELETAAEDGDLEAAYQLGQHYCRGSGGAEKDEKRAFTGSPGPPMATILPPNIVLVCVGCGA